MDKDFIVKCPWCGHEHNGLDYVKPNYMDGDFVMDCENKECRKQFAVYFKTKIDFKTEKSE